MILIALAVLVAAGGYFCASAAGRATAEETTAKAWVICQPGDYVNLRAKATKQSRAVSRLDCGDMVELDGKTKNGYARVVNLTIDGPGEVWIYTGYLVFDEPRWYGDEMTVVGNARVAARKNCGGDVRRWLQPGTDVWVYWMSEDWCVTNRGFIRTKYLEVGSV